MTANTFFLDGYEPHEQRIVSKIPPNDRDEPITIESYPLEGFHWLNKFYKKLAYLYVYEKIPVVSMLFSTGFTFWLILIYVTWCIYREKYRLLAPVSFPLVLWLTMIAGPLELYRYTFPLAMTIPILFTRILTDEEILC